MYQLLRTFLWLLLLLGNLSGLKLLFVHRESVHGRLL